MVCFCFSIALQANAHEGKWICRHAFFTRSIPWQWRALQEFFQFVWSTNYRTVSTITELHSEINQNIPGFIPSQQHANNVSLLYSVKSVTCGDLFSKYKLDYKKVRSELQTALYDASYIWAFDELELMGRLKTMCVKNHKCYDLIETLVNLAL